MHSWNARKKWVCPLWSWQEARVCAWCHWCGVAVPCVVDWLQLVVAVTCISATVNQKVVAGDVAGHVGSEEHHWCNDFWNFTQATHWCA